MLPSDYVRLGIAIRPRQVTHILVDDDNASCVMGAMIEGHAGRKLDYMEAQKYCDVVLREMKWLYGQVACPVCGKGGKHWRVVDVAVELNNTHGWSREKIGDWMDQFAVDAEAPSKGKRDAGSQETPGAAEREEVCV